MSRSGGDAATGLSPFIKIEWDGPHETNGAPILGYQVEMSSGSGAYSVAYDGSTNAVQRSFKFQNLGAGSTYHFRVKARNVKGYSPAGPAITIIAATMPFKMTPPTVSTIVPNDQLSTLEITWTTPTENGGSAITGYYVQRNSGYGTSYIEPGTFVAVGTNAYTFTNLVEGATYLFRIAAVNTIYTTNKFFDDILNFSEGTSHIVALAPDQVTVFSQRTADYEKGKVKLQWTAPNMNGSPVKYYTLLKDVGSGIYYPLYKGSDTSYTDEGLVEGQSYNYKVYATNAAGDGPVSTAIVTYAAEFPGIIR